MFVTLQTKVYYAQTASKRNCRMIRKAGYLLIIALMGVLMSSCKVLHKDRTKSVPLPQTSLTDTVKPSDSNTPAVAQGEATPDNNTIVADPQQDTAADTPIVAPDSQQQAAADNPASAADSQQKAAAENSASAPDSQQNAVANTPSSAVNTQQKAATDNNALPSDTQQNTTARKTPQQATPAATAGKSSYHGKQQPQPHVASPPATAPDKPDAQKAGSEPADDRPQQVAAKDSATADTISDKAAETATNQLLTNDEELSGEDNEAENESNQEHPIIMATLIILLIILALLFLTYHIYMRRKLDEVQQEGEDALWELRMQHQQQREWNDAAKSKAASGPSQAEVDRAIADLQHEKEAAIQARETALSEKQKALSEMDKALSEKNLAISEKDKALSEKDLALTEKEAALTAKDAAITERDAALSEKVAALSERDAALSLLAERDAKLAEQADSLKAKDAALAQKDAELTNVVAELEEAKKANVAPEPVVVQQPEAPVATPDVVPDLVETAPVVAEAVPTAEDRDDEIRSMRKILIGKLELARTLLDMKGEKKGEVISDEEWKDVEMFLEKADNRFVSRFSEKFPELTRKDIQLMMLLRLKVPSKNIAQIYGINEKSVKQKLFVYKTKVGMDSDSASLRDFVETF